MFQPNVVTSPCPAGQTSQNVVLASAACTFAERQMSIVLHKTQPNLVIGFRLAVSWGVSCSFGMASRPPKAPQGHGHYETTSPKCLLVARGPPVGVPGPKSHPRVAATGFILGFMRRLGCVSSPLEAQNWKCKNLSRSTAACSYVFCTLSIFSWGAPSPCLPKASKQKAQQQNGAAAH